MALTNQQLLTRGDRRYVAKKKAASGAVLEYNPDSRKDFLTGFHKRKLERQADAKRRAEELNRQQRIVERRKLREARREKVEPGLERLKEAEALIEGRRTASEDDETVDDDKLEPQSEGENEFSGFTDSSGILKRRDVTYGDSNVTIEEISMDPYVDMSRSEAVLDEATRKANEYASYVQSLDNAAAKQEEQRQRQRKKKFRYLPKSERRSASRKRRS